jgi:predicted nucleic acid-binding protein
MPIYLLDTNIIIDVLNGKHNRAALLDDLIAQGGLLASCPITVSEIYAGIRPKEVARTEHLLARLEYYDISKSTAKRAGLLKRDYSKRGQSLTLADTLIAAVCLENDLVLITENQKHFPMPELQSYPLAARSKAA